MNEPFEEVTDNEYLVACMDLVQQQQQHTNVKHTAQPQSLFQLAVFWVQTSVGVITACARVMRFAATVSPTCAHVLLKLYVLYRWYCMFPAAAALPY